MAQQALTLLQAGLSIQNEVFPVLDRPLNLTHQH